MKRLINALILFQLVNFGCVFPTYEFIHSEPVRLNTDRIAEHKVNIIRSAKISDALRVTAQVVVCAGLCYYAYGYVASGYNKITGKETDGIAEIPENIGEMVGRHDALLKVVEKHIGLKNNTFWEQCKSFGQETFKLSASLIFSFAGNRIMDSLFTTYSPKYVFGSHTHLRQLVDQMKHSATLIVEDDMGVLAQFDYHRAAMMPFCTKLAHELEFAIAYLEYQAEVFPEEVAHKLGLDTLAPYLSQISNDFFDCVYKYVSKQSVSQDEKDALILLLEEYDNEITALINRCVLTA